MKRKFLFACIACFCLQFSFSQTCKIKGEVSKIVDGDTIIVTSQSNKYTIRLNGIDCPEKAQEFGREATKFTKKICFKEKVVVSCCGTDKYQRIIGDVYVETNGICVNEELLRNGWAYWYYKYSTNQELQKIENSAKTNQLGVWSVSNSILPWVWRHDKKYKEYKP